MTLVDLTKLQKKDTINKAVLGLHELKVSNVDESESACLLVCLSEYVSPPSNALQCASAMHNHPSNALACEMDWVRSQEARTASN